MCFVTLLNCMATEDELFDDVSNEDPNFLWTEEEIDCSKGLSRMRNQNDNAMNHCQNNLRD